MKPHRVSLRNLAEKTLAKKSVFYFSPRKQYFVQWVFRDETQKKKQTFFLG